MRRRRRAERLKATSWLPCPLLFRSATREDMVAIISGDGNKDIVKVFDRIACGRDVGWVHFLSLENCEKAISCGVVLSELEPATERPS